jgi:hypothetical protein
MKMSDLRAKISVGTAAHASEKMADRLEGLSSDTSACQSMASAPYVSPLELLQ